MIAGIGIDMVDIRRFEALVARFPHRLHKIFTEQEMALAHSRTHPAAALAKRFAAKEAFAKALGTGMRGVKWREIEIGRDTQGKPAFILSGAAAAGLGERTAHLSLSDEYPYAQALVILESP